MLIQWGPEFLYRSLKQLLFLSHDGSAAEHSATRESVIDNEVSRTIIPRDISPERSKYDKQIASLRKTEYPGLEGNVYLDHAGTAIPAKSLLQSFASEATATLFGNPHSDSPSSQRSAQLVDDVRLQVLDMFSADPRDFEVVFVANATAGIKLVVDALRDRGDGFWFGYHGASHTSMVGVREVAKLGTRCFESDQAVRAWLNAVPSKDEIEKGSWLFGYPAQSSMDGRRLPLCWSRELRNKLPSALSLLDAAALVSTGTLDLSDAAAAPDFTVLSFYKMFGFPELGALIVRKASAHVFESRRYFGGGTVDTVTCFDDEWHSKKASSLHDSLEDGTLPFRNILALKLAHKAHRELYGSASQISTHTAFLAKLAFDGLSSMKHADGSSACVIYTDQASSYSDPSIQGPVIAFNVQDRRGNWMSNYEINKVAALKNIHLRIGNLCTPGTVARALNLSSADLRQNHENGFRCGLSNDVVGDKALGMIRVSFGAMSTLEDVDALLNFVHELVATPDPIVNMQAETNLLHVESLTVYPIKCCGGWSVPSNIRWPVRPEGLLWDREWCLIHRGTRKYLNQKRCPRMALLKPEIDTSNRLLRIRYGGAASEGTPSSIEIPLDIREADFTVDYTCPTTVCGDSITPKTYGNAEISSFFSSHLSVPCQLVRLPSTQSTTAQRTVKQVLAEKSVWNIIDSPEFAGPQFSRGKTSTELSKLPLLLANESPILVVSRSSIEALNGRILERDGSLSSRVEPEAFRPNIVVASDCKGLAFVEDSWASLSFKGSANHEESSNIKLRVFGPCRRCQMVCIDQETGNRRTEPFLTLSKTRSWGGGVWFGVHCGLDGMAPGSLQVGDLVTSTKVIE